mmetsp:Transcript_638/g.1336  ORF Transcript_638/g.1336 Transcript_638/m.1336 type:complete len:86 (-) Transcript_638:382-639(-)
MNERMNEVLIRCKHADRRNQKSKKQNGSVSQSWQEARDCFQQLDWESKKGNFNANASVIIRSRHKAVMECVVWRNRSLFVSLLRT